MAEFTGLGAAKAEEILGMSVASMVVNESGHLIFTRVNGSTIDAGDLTAILSDLTNEALDENVNLRVSNAQVGTTEDKGVMSSGNLDFTPFNSATLVNSLILVTISGDITISTADIPSSPKTNCRFRVRVQQHNTGGGHHVNLVGFKRPSAATGPIVSSTSAFDVDVLEFFFDGTYWYAQNVLPDVTVT